MWSPSQTSDNARNNAVQEERVREYPDIVRASVMPGTSASSATDQHCGSNTSDLAGDQTQLEAQLRQSSRVPLKFEASAGDSDRQHHLQRRRRANRESARTVRKRRTQHCGALETQAAESNIKNKRLLKKVADVHGDNSLAASLLQAFHLKVAHMHGMNESLRLKVAIMERQADAQVRNQVQIEHVGPALSWKAPDATADIAPPAAEWLSSSPAWAPVCNPPAALPGAVQPQPSQARAVSPFAHTRLLSQAAPLPELLNQDWDASLGSQGSQTAALPSVYTNAARAESMDAMLSVFTSEQPAARMQRSSSLTLSRGLSAMLNAFSEP